MFQLTMFGGTEGELPLTNLFSFTLCGGAERWAPTLARRLLHMRATRQRTPSLWERLFEFERNTIITICGGTEILLPTLIEELGDLRAALRTQALPAAEARQLLEELNRRGGTRDLYTAFTLFGACTLERPKPDTERKALDLALRTGMITANERAELDGAIGRPLSEVVPVLERLALGAH
jgi:hypothetical protein